MTGHPWLDDILPDYPDFSHFMILARNRGDGMLDVVHIVAVDGIPDVLQMDQFKEDLRVNPKFEYVDILDKLYVIIYDREGNVIGEVMKPVIH